MPRINSDEEEFVFDDFNIDLAMTAAASIKILVP
jgi:hypothetical protein